VSPISTETSRFEAFSLSWPGEYLRDHTVHILVVLGFVLYPFVQAILIDIFGITAQMILPQVSTMTALMWLGLFAMSFDFISGYTGYLSFGHAAFFGTGAYFTILAHNGQIPFLPPELPFMSLIILSAIVAAVLAFLVGVVSFRLTGVYFAMITLGFAELLFVVSENWDWLTPGVADPRDGIAMQPTNQQFVQPEIGVPFVDSLQVEIGRFGSDTLFGLDSLLGVAITPTHVSFYALGAVVLICYLLMQRIIHSPFGRVMIAIRENEERAKAIGYKTFRFKMGALMISAFFGAIAGALMVGFNQAADPTDSFYFLVTGFALVASIIGGLGTLAGPLFGYLFFEAVDEFLAREGQGGGLQPFLEQTLPDSVLNFAVGNLTIDEALSAFMTGHAEFYTGLIFVIFVLYAPIGILGTLRERYGGQTIADSVTGWIEQRGSSETEE